MLMESDHNMGFDQVSNLNGTKRACEGTSENSDSTNKKTRVSENLDDNHEEQPVLKPEIDLNVSIKEVYNVDDVGEFNQIAHEFELNGTFNEVINISSDDDDDKKLAISRNDKQKGVECNLGLDLHLGYNNEGGDKKRYTKEEKGKAKVDYLLSLSLTHEFLQVDMFNEAIELDPIETFESVEAMTSITVNPQDLVVPKNQETESTSKMDKNMDFSGEIKDIIDRNSKCKAEKLIDWSPRRVDFRPVVVPSLLDLSLDVLAKNADAISSFDHVPDCLKRKLTNMLCDGNKMSIHILELLFKGSPTEIRVKNCSWMTQKQLVDALAKSNLQNLRVLQLDYCGQCSFDDIIPNSLAQFSNSLPFLGILSLRGAARLSNNTLKTLLMSAPLLQSIDLSQCTLLTSTAIEIMFCYLKNSLKELYIDDCLKIEPMHCISSIINFENLEVLSVAGIETVCDVFITLVTTTCGAKLKELNLAGCVLLTDSCLQAIGDFCPALCSLNISNLCNLTDLGLCYLADGCKSLESLNVTRAGFSDEVVAAFLETSGQSLKQLSLNHVGKVRFNTAFSLAKCSRNLVSLDLSWCRNLTDVALGFITDNCLSLKLLKIFGCTQLTESFLLGHSNSQLLVVGRDPVPLLERVNMFEPEEALLHHSALKTPTSPQFPVT